MRFLGILFILALGAMCGWAQKPQTAVNVVRPVTDTSVRRPSTSVSVIHPQTTVAVEHPVTTQAVVHPQTTVSVSHPVTTISVVEPQTTVQVTHPQTTVAVEHPTTFDAGRTAQTGGSATGTGGKSTATSMSNFQPKQAKDFTAGNAKAAPGGGGTLKLGNETDESAKDSAAASSALRGEQNKNMSVDPTKSSANLGSLEQHVSQAARQADNRK